MKRQGEQDGARLHLGRRRRLSARRQGLLANRLPDLRVPVEGAPPASLNPFSLQTPSPRETWLELGFGGGEHLLYQARRHPDCLHIGCEPYAAGTARLLSDLAADTDAPANLRLHDGDAADLLRILTDSCIARIHLLFPDPWPKRRHHKRRITRPTMLAEMERVLTPGGILYMATDSPAYAGWTLAQARRCRQLAWQANHPQDWQTPPQSRPPTRYEAKALAANREIIHLLFRREKS